MKKRLLASLLLTAFSFALNAQESSQNQVKGDIHLNDAVNTLAQRLTLSGYLQTGYTYDPAQEVESTFDIKRIILMTHAQITDRWSAYFMFGYAGSAAKTQEIYTEYAFSPALKARIGQFKTPYSIENLISPTVAELIAPYSQAVNYLAAIGPADRLHGSSAGRDQGIMFYGDIVSKDDYAVLSYKLAVMNGQGINVSDKNNNKDVSGALTVKPCKDFGITASFIRGKGYAMESVGGIAAGSDYTRNRWSIGATAQSGPLSLRTEYLEGKDGDLESHGYYATMLYNILPKIDLIASYDYFKYETDSTIEQSNYVGGVQYRFYPKCRLQLQYTYRDASFVGASAPAGSPLSAHDLVQMQFQVRF